MGEVALGLQAARLNVSGLSDFGAHGSSENRLRLGRTHPALRAPLPSSSLPINKLNTPVRREHFGAHDKYNKHLWTEIHARNRG